ncbi:unnamed protein product [Medioppia subpectinata]|uniref:Uncharacterized protein n=1 Tax=Medioppia subpectinata TaxID=1979941 RepID=A0A7R9KR69_9ACAR|nr:unnamed protein product [Medioppia subpectinata]CAG2107096.1 unnamed protein product [Medioppia subpectinata]
MITELAYGPLKAAVDMLTRVLALQLGPSGVRVNAVNPGATQVTDKLDPPVVWEKTRSFTPLKRLGQPLDVAKAVAFLASTDAQFITGANLFVDGGLVHNMGAMNTMFGDMIDDANDYRQVAKSRDFTGKVVLVTGSSSGIGAGIAKLFAVLGAHVVVTARTADNVRKVAKQCHQLSPHKIAPLEVTADLTKSSDLKRVIDETVKTYGKLDVLVNNAGIRSARTLITAPDVMDKWDQLYSLDLRSVLELTHIAIPHLIQSKGTIINISAIGGIAPMSINLVYGPVKSGLDMLTRVLALQLGPKGVRVNTINPGAIQVTEKLEPAEVFDKCSDITPLKRIGQPLDVAKAVAFLASSDAEFITGANLVVDGGMHYNASALTPLLGTDIE